MSRKKPANVVVEPVHARVIRGPRTDGRYYWQARVSKGEKGDARSVWSGWATRDEAVDKIHELIRTEGLDRKDEVEAIETVRDLLEVWTAAQDKRADLSASWGRTCTNSGKRLCARIGDVRLQDVTRTTLERYRDESLRSARNPEGIASATVHQDLKRLRSAWTWGRELSFTPDRDLPRVGVKITPERDKHTPSAYDVVRVIEAMDEGWPRLAVRLLFGTGARIGEIAQLTWGDIDWQRGRIHIRHSKTGARTVPLHTQLIEELRAWKPREREPDPDEGLFGVSWKLVRAKLGPRDLSRACDTARVKRFTPHALRRAAVDAFRRAGVDTKTAASWLGHSDAVMLAYYAQPSDEDREAALATTQLGVLPVVEAIDVDAAPEPVPHGTGSETGSTRRRSPVEPDHNRAGEGQVAHPEGLEPPTLGSEVRCSVH
jgi:integrase